MAELTEAVTDYEYDVKHSYKHVVSYKMDAFLEMGTVLALLACKWIVSRLIHLILVIVVI